MDLFKAITGKNPAEYEHAASVLMNTPDIKLFKQLVDQEDFLFDFIKNNVSKRIKQACTKDNYLNLFKFFDYYSPSYDEVFADIFNRFGDENTVREMADLIINGNNSQKTYALKYFSHSELSISENLINIVRKLANNTDEFLSNNAIEVLSKNKDEESKNNAVKKLESTDEFEQYNAVKFLVTYGAKDTLNKIIQVMKTSSLSENIASEIPYLTDLESLLENDYENGILVLCNIINAIPEIIQPTAVFDYNLAEIFKNLYYSSLNSTSALLLRMAKEKFEDLANNEEYLFDCDKNTKDEIINLNKFLKSININKLNSLLYDELYDESDFVLFAIDFVSEAEVLETLLDSSNQTLILKVLTTLKEKNLLKDSHKQTALKHVTNNEIKQIIEVL